MGDFFSFLESASVSFLYLSALFQTPKTLPSSESSAKVLSASPKVMVAVTGVAAVVALAASFAVIVGGDPAKYVGEVILVYYLEAVESISYLLETVSVAVGLAVSYQLLW